MTAARTAAEQAEHEAVAQAALDKYASLPRRGKPKRRDNQVREWTVMAAVCLVKSVGPSRRVHCVSIGCVESTSVNNRNDRVDVRRALQNRFEGPAALEIASARRRAARFACRGHRTARLPFMDVCATRASAPSRNGKGKSSRTKRLATRSALFRTQSRTVLAPPSRVADSTLRQYAAM